MFGKLCLFSRRIVTFVVFIVCVQAADARTVSQLLPVANTSTHELARSSVFGGTNFLVGIRGSATAAGEACAQLVSAAGVPIGSLIQTGRDVSVGGSTPSAPILAFGSGKFLMVWTDSASQHPASGDDIYGQFIEQSGTLLGGVFPVYAGSGSEMAVGVASDGVDFFVIWSDSSSGLWGRPVSSSGSLGSAELFSTTTIGHNASVAYGGGQYLVAWMDGPYSPRYPVARRYSTGGVMSSPILLGTGSWSYNPVNVGYGDGRFLVGWHHRYSEEEDWNLRGRIVLPDGTMPAGELSLISSDSPEYALWQNITFDGDYFLLCWLQAESFAATGITYGQYFNSAANLMGSPFEIDATSGGGFKIPGGTSAHNGKALVLITTDAMGSAGDVHAVLIDSSTHVDIHSVGAGQMQLEYKGILESETNLVSGSWEKLSPQPASPWNFTAVEESRYFRARRLEETESTDSNLRALLLGTWRVAPDNNPSGMYFINTYRDVGTMSSEEHIPGYPVETYHGTFVVEGDKLYLDWGGGDTYTLTISIDGDTLSGTDMADNSFTGIRQ